MKQYQKEQGDKLTERERLHSFVLGVILESINKVRYISNRNTVWKQDEKKCINHAVDLGYDYLLPELLDWGNVISLQPRKETIRERNHQAV